MLPTGVVLRVAWTVDRDVLKGKIDLGHIPIIKYLLPLALAHFVERNDDTRAPAGEDVVLEVEMRLRAAH